MKSFLIILLVSLMNCVVGYCANEGDCCDLKDKKLNIEGCNEASERSVIVQPDEKSKAFSKKEAVLIATLKRTLSLFKATLLTEVIRTPEDLKISLLSIEECITSSTKVLNQCFESLKNEEELSVLVKDAYREVLLKIIYACEKLPDDMFEEVLSSMTISLKSMIYEYYPREDQKLIEIILVTLIEKLTKAGTPEYYFHLYDSISSILVGVMNKLPFIIREEQVNNFLGVMLKFDISQFEEFKVDLFKENYVCCLNLLLLHNTEVFYKKTHPNFLYALIKRLLKLNDLKNENGRINLELSVLNLLYSLPDNFFLDKKKEGIELMHIFLKEIRSSISLTTITSVGELLKRGVFFENDKDALFIYIKIQFIWKNLAEGDPKKAEASKPHLRTILDALLSYFLPCRAIKNKQLLLLLIKDIEAYLGNPSEGTMTLKERPIYSKFKIAKRVFLKIISKLKTEGFDEDSIPKRVLTEMSLVEAIEALRQRNLDPSNLSEKSISELANRVIMSSYVMTIPRSASNQKSRATKQKRELKDEEVYGCHMHDYEYTKGCKECMRENLYWE